MDWRAIGSFAVALIVGCNPAPPRVDQDRPDSQAASIALELFDADHSGVLQAEELNQVPGLKAALATVDRNQDGAVSTAEIQARMDRWAASRMGRMTVTCVVSRRGKPLPGVEVRFVPEPFLKGTIQPAVGLTDERGVALPSGPASEDFPRGVGPGFYRVEITGVDPPVREEFNTKTTLGVEVAADSTALMSGALKFEIGP